MSLSDEIERLKALHQSGALTDDEFARAKAAALTQANDPWPVQEQLGDIQFQNELARLDREWTMIRDQYMVSGKYGSRNVPDDSWSGVWAAIGVALGLGILYHSLVNQRGVDWLPSLLTSGIIIAISYFHYKSSTALARAYRQALSHYKAERAELIAAHARGKED